jgi:acyl-coenzyme A thioesterase PaaI-like protein
MIADERHLTRPDGQVWTRIGRGNFSSLFGPIWMRSSDQRPVYAILVEEKHNNGANRAHGGLIMSFCDEALGLAAHVELGPDPLLTISFDCQFIGAASIGDFVEVDAKVVKATRSFAFLHGTCTVEGNIVAVCSGVWKRTRAKQGGP